MKSMLQKDYLKFLNIYYYYEKRIRNTSYSLLIPYSKEGITMNNIITLNARLDNSKYAIRTESITTILDYLVVADGTTYNVRETTAEILEKISTATTEEKVPEEEIKPMSTKEIFEGLGIDLDETFESIFGFHPNDDINTVAKKLTGKKAAKKKVRRIVRTPFGPIATWVEEE